MSHITHFDDCGCKTKELADALNKIKQAKGDLLNLKQDLTKLKTVWVYEPTMGELKGNNFAMNERATRVADFVDSILKNLNRKKI
jgi:hypothetical protein